MTPEAMLAAEHATAERYRGMLADCQAELERAQSNHVALLRQIGASGFCAGCRKAILWVRHRNGAAAPYDLDGVNHFITCMKRDQFRKKKEAQHGR